LAQGKPKKKGGWIVTGAAAAVLAVLTGFAGGFGTKLADVVSSGNPKLLSHSVEALESRCFGGEFIPQSAVKKVLEEGPGNWEAVEGQPGAAPITQDIVQVSIQGESARKITLTGIKVHASRHSRPAGASFAEACGGPIEGRALEVDLDADPPRVVDSTATTDGLLGVRGPGGERIFGQIRFPWSVSLTDPLLLYLVARTQSCHCEWSAEIPWVSGGERGAIVIDEGHAVTYSAGLPHYGEYDNRWKLYPYR
jgi:hypothetical protein